MDIDILYNFANLPTYRWTVERYNAMIDAGILNKYDKTELLAGRIVPKDRKSPRKARTRSILHKSFVLRLGSDDTYSTWPGLAITLGDHSEPEPDLSIIRGEATQLTHRPYAENIALVVEVTDTNPNKNKICKRYIYAASDIQEYWIIDVYGQSVEQYLDPQEDGTYATVNKLGKQDEIVSVEPGAYQVSDLLA